MVSNILNLTLLEYWTAHCLLCKSNLIKNQCKVFAIKDNIVENSLRYFNVMAKYEPSPLFKFEHLCTFNNQLTKCLLYLDAKRLASIGPLLAWYDWCENFAEHK